MSFKSWKFQLKSLIRKVVQRLEDRLPILPIHLKKTGRPRKVCRSTQDWVLKPKFWWDFSPQHYVAIYPGFPIERQPPKTIDPNLHWQFKLDYGNQSEIAFVATIPGGRFWNHCAVISPDNQLLADTSLFFQVDPGKTPEKHPIFWKEIPKPEYFSGTLAVLAAPGGNTYFHWLFDVLPRIDLLRKSQVDMGSIDHFIVNAIDLPFQKQTLELLHIPTEKLLTSRQHPHVSADRLVVTSFPRHQTCNIGKWVFDFIQKELREKALSQQFAQQPTRLPRLYISRANASRRKVTNEPEVTGFLHQYGFQVVHLETLSIVEQIQLFATAECIVAPHGAGLTNLVFCSPHTKVIEIYSPNYVSVSYWNISTQVGLDYYYLFGEGESPKENIDPHHLGEDILVSMESLKRTFDLAQIT